MLLAIDIGNTTTSFGIIDSRKVYSIKNIDTDIAKRSYKTKLSKVLNDIEERYPLIDDVVICSVVPEVLSSVKKLISGIFQKAPKIIGEDIIVPMRNRYRDPKQVGQDRLVGAYAAKEL
ncbi:MAG: type III pantothenate kinase, partial [Candidatus Omnitrophica bacterium]|nr:type III pantothenate kinase [Candidatus Omnitrophota bacterium]